jgi:hypothetical protein
MNKTKIWLIGAILLVILVGLLIWGTLKESANIKTNNNAKNELMVNSEELIGLTMRIPGGNRNGYWEINCAKLINVNQFGTLTTINGQYYSANKPIYRLVAESGRIYWESSILKLQGNVKLSMNDGTKLTADEIVWNSKTDKIQAQNNVSLTTRSLVVKTEQIIAGSDLRKVDLKGMTHVSFKDSRGGK